jgi:DNA-binding transcriptional LysR family regulator
MDIHQLKVFASVYKHRSFSKASEKLYLTQPTISNHVKSLEEELDCKLFDRLGRTIIPTKEADVLYTYSKEIIEKAEDLKELISRFQKELTGRIIIGASTIPGTYLLPQLMTDFHKKFPSLSFQINIDDSKGIINSILNHEILLGIVGVKLDDNNINYVPFIEDELIAISSPDLRAKGKMHIEELVKLPIIMREEGSGTRKETERIFKRRGISLNTLHIAGIFGSTDAVKQAVKAGLGISILSRFAVVDELRQRSLVEIKPVGEEMKRSFFIASHKKRTLPRAYETFLDHIKTASKRLS